MVPRNDVVSTGLAHTFVSSFDQEGQLSVTGESMCTKYWLTTKEV